MREIVVIERVIAPANGRNILQERRYHALLLADGGFRLLACCGKRCPLPRAVVPRFDERTKKHRETAA